MKIKGHRLRELLEIVDEFEQKEEAEEKRLVRKKINKLLYSWDKKRNLKFKKN